MSRHSQRPTTWGGAQPGSSFSTPTSPGVEGGGFGFEPSVPSIYRRTWSIFAQSSSDSVTSPTDDIPLSLLHKFFSSSGGLGPGQAERIVNAACKSNRCSRIEFYTALGLLVQLQQGEGLNLGVVQQRLASGTLSEPRLDMDAMGTCGGGHTFPPTAAAAGVRPAGTVREMNDPWNASTSNAFGAYEGVGGNSYDSAFRGGFGSSNSGPSSSRTKNNLFAHNGGASTSTSDTLHPPPRQPRTTAPAPRPFSYMSETAETNALDASLDPSADLPEDIITVRLRSGLEGFIIKHNVYIVTSSLRETSVTRRYSDWIWLSECLAKRYPFRCLPVLPPKRIAVPIAGRHLSAENLFIERRRRGLERYLRLLVCHPVLREDKLVQVFLEEVKPVSDWKRKVPALFLDEEGLVKVVNEAERMTIPEDLELKLTQQRQAIPELLERWTNMVALFERIVKRNDAAAADYSRLNFSLLSVVESSSKRWRPESDRSGKTEEVINVTAGAVQEFSELLSSRVSSVSLSTLEGFKAQRDLILSFRDLISRIDRQLVDPIDQLKKRIEANQRKISALTTATPSNRSASQDQQATLTAQVKQDTASIAKYLNRRVHAKKTVWEELIWFHHRFKAVEGEMGKFVRDESFWFGEVGRAWEASEMRLKMIR
ncbi:hypothetical protein NDA11_004436 [Ustilago hordei]|nr:hypothetical protein NDA10_000158 [Ustilago hordei]KAJ1583793.1 hypothetical protein NDA15_006851 [Ustilago hordei]KAJ1586703.1 hypothetical protein NDA11_004436 [Ustilago hordei]KAJ1591511.1 hypothetical protein NDA12_000403 [Ustilago hordei]UTT94673.1 hypothetical protein NDA17_003083 [Ustilago hordei]